MDASVELVKQCLSSVVYIHAEVPAAHPSTRILGDERMGTGTVIDPSGLILTVNYVVMGGETIQVSFAKGRTQRAEIVAQDFELGLALLKVKRTGLASVAVASSDRLERGQSVFALGSTGPRERRLGGRPAEWPGRALGHPGGRCHRLPRCPPRSHPQGSLSLALAARPRGAHRARGDAGQRAQAPGRHGRRPR